MSGRAFFIVLVLLFPLMGNAQYFNQGVEPGKVKWRQIDTDQFQVIFPKGADSLGQQVTRYLLEAGRVASRSLTHQPRKIAVILHTHTVRSNGFVAWAPKRSEWYVTPPPSSDTQDWLAHLALHEYRHVVQTDRMNQGVTKVLATIFGEQGLAYSSGMLPFWYLEGDAVWTETALSSSGRGRDPSFLRIHRTKLLSDEPMFSLDQSLFGSYKQLVPNHYQTGYLLTAFGRKVSGRNTWQQVQDRVAQFPHGILPTPWPFAVGMKRHFGYNQKQFYHHAMDSLQLFWDGWTPANEPQQYEPLTSENSTDYVDYRSPVLSHDGTLYAIRRTYDETDCIVSIIGKEEIVVTPVGKLISDRITTAKGLFAWAERRSHPRWENLEYAEVWLYDNQRDRLSKVREKTRWFSPALSPDGNTLAVIEVSPLNTFYLELVNPFNGKEIQSLEAPGGHFISHPVWRADGKALWVLETAHDQKYIRKYHIQADAWGKPISLTSGDIQWIDTYDEGLVFHATESGLDQLYQYNTQNASVNTLSEDTNGLRDFCISANSKRIIASRYTSRGSELVSMPFEQHANKLQSNGTIPFQSAWKQESAKFSSNPYIDTVFTIQKYPRFAHLFNFHSWLPLYADIGEISQSADFQAANQTIIPGITLLSQNKLSTTTSYLSYGYRSSSHYLASGISYQGWFPVFQLEARVGGNTAIYSATSEWLPDRDEPHQELLVRGFVPLDFSQANYVVTLKPQVEYNFTNASYYNYAHDYYQKGYDELRGSVNFSYYKRMAMRDLLPNWGVLLQGNYIHSLKDEGLFGDIYYGYGILYLKGLARNDGFRLLAGFQKQDPGLYLFGTKLNFPRGYEATRTEKLFLFRGSYHVPLVYPDWSIGSFAYIKRLRLNLFYDFGRNSFQQVHDEQAVTQIRNLHSLGSEISVDAHLFRMMLPISMGIRTGYKPRQEKGFVESFINLQLNQF